MTHTHTLFVMWLLRKHWRALFIVHIYVIIASLKFNKIPKKYFKNYK